MRKGGHVISLNGQVFRAFCLVTALLLVCFTGLLPQASAAQLEDKINEYVVLDLIGYNYTNRHIRSYDVDGNGGGDVRLSSPTSGGGGIVCCVRLSMKGKNPIIVRIRWQVDGCSYLMNSERSGTTQRLSNYFYKEEYIEVPRPEGIKPRHLESHFYPDGSVVVRLTYDMSTPRLSLSESRPDKSKFPKCENDKNP
jgi:hypothetical protein